MIQVSFADSHRAGLQCTGGKKLILFIMINEKDLDHCGTTPHNRARPGLRSDSDIIHPCEEKGDYQLQEKNKSCVLSCYLFGSSAARVQGLQSK